MALGPSVHFTWSRRLGCETCEGSGYVLRWVSLPELRALLRDEA